MSCAVAVSGSPVFSPARVSLLCRSASSPETQTQTLTLTGSAAAAASPSAASLSSPSSFRLRCLQKQTSGFRVCKIDACVVDSDPPPSSSSSSSSSSTVLKRKRPARIDIPLSSTGFAMPMVPEGPKEVEIESARFYVYCKKGRREAMEDRHTAVVDLQGDPKQAFFGVFDGHGGSRAAEFTSENIEKKIMDEVMKGGGDDGILDAVKSGYLTTDSEFLKEEVRGGTCCVTALIRNGNLVVSNAGDCRAVMCKGGVAEALTVDHRPSREDEKGRIESLGGYVDCCHGMWRLQGTLAVSRGIGDLHLKKWVIAEPETKIIRLKPECEFLILASDGLWDKVSNQEAVDMVRPLCISSDDRPSLLPVCKELVDLSVMRGSADDISVMIIPLRHFI